MLRNLYLAYQDKTFGIASQTVRGIRINLICNQSFGAHDTILLALARAGDHNGTDRIFFVLHNQHDQHASQKLLLLFPITYITPNHRINKVVA